MFLINHRLFCQGHRIKKNIVRWCFFISLFVSLQVDAQSLTLYVIPPKKPMDWRSPRHLLKSYIKTFTAKTKYKGYAHPIGHVIVELKDSQKQIVCGMVAESLKPLTLMASIKGYGLGILSVVTPGKLLEGKHNNDDIEQRKTHGDLAYIRYELSSETVERLWQYLEEYKNRGYDKMYNGCNMPRAGQGAGCSAFALSFLEIAGLYQEEVHDAWQVKIDVPQRLIGGELYNKHKVSLLKVWRCKTWANPLYNASQAISYFEPYLMFQWIQTKWQEKATNEINTYSIELNGLSKGIVYNFRNQLTLHKPLWNELSLNEK